jgi:repressor LexA
MLTLLNIHALHSFVINTRICEVYVIIIPRRYEVVNVLFPVHTKFFEGEYEMDDTLKRIEEEIEAANMKKTRFFQLIGIPQSTWYTWKKTGRVPDKDYLIKIADCLGVSVDYILTGKQYLGSGKPIDISLESAKIGVLGRVAAGVPIDMIEDIIGEESISMELAKTGTFFGLRISGDSMEPRMFSGDVVIVRQQEDVESGQVAIVSVNGDEATCKKVEKHSNGIMLVPFNSKYEEKFFTNEEIEKLPVRVLGRVVEVRGRL